MELLIKRDKTLLKETEGDAIVSSDVPDFLKTPKVVPSYFVTNLNERGNEDDLLVHHPSDYYEIAVNFNPRLVVSRYRDKLEATPALWSGHRSVLVKDNNIVQIGRGKLYRLKGISVNLREPSTFRADGHLEIRGGQKISNAHFEAEMTQKFNKVLEEVGIEPVMKPVGMWKYPITVNGLRPVTSIFEVKGDTRLDEVIRVIEGLAMLKFYKVKDVEKKEVDIGKWTPLGATFFEASKNLMQKVGYTVGRLKRLMDRNGQTWSSDHNQTNAHIGNIVLYNGTDKLKVGLVDFDASCDIRDYTKSHLESLQKREYRDLISSSHGVISPRQMSGKPFLEEHIRCGWIRDAFIEGLKKGYAIKQCDHYSNEIDLSELNMVFNTLRADGEFSKPTLRQILEPYKVKEKKVSRVKRIDLDAMIERHLATGETQSYTDRKTGGAIYIGSVKSKRYPPLKISKEELDSVYRGLYKSLHPAKAKN